MKKALILTFGLIVIGSNYFSDGKLVTEAITFASAIVKWLVSYA
jgi:hypothetical protein